MSIEISDKRMTFTPLFGSHVIFEGDIVDDVSSSFLASQKAVEQACEREHNGKTLKLLNDEDWLVSLDGRLVFVTAEEARENGFSTDVTVKREVRGGKVCWLPVDAPDSDG